MGENAGMRGTTMEEFPSNNEEVEEVEGWSRRVVLGNVEEGVGVGVPRVGV